MQMQYAHPVPSRRTTPISLGKVVRWALPLIAIAALSVALSASLPAAVDGLGASAQVVYTGDPDHGQLVPEVSQGRR